MSVHRTNHSILPALLFLWLLWIIRPGDAFTQSHEPGVRVIDADELAEAGVYRLSDLFWLVDDWTSYSVNDFTWFAAPSGLASPQTSEWILLVDGRPIDPGGFNVQNINTLPLRIDDIDRVEISSIPTLVAGRIAHAGAIHLYTYRPAMGLQFQGSAAPGSEVGDPGPYEYTGHETHNVDRIGPNYGASVSYSGPAWYGRIGTRIDERHADHHIRPRVNVLCNQDCRIKGAPVVNYGSGYAEAGVHGLLGQHRAFGYRTSLIDQFFFSPAGIEIPTDYRYTDGGAEGSIPFSERVRIRYDAGYSRLQHDQLVGNASFDWLQDRVRGRAQIELEDANYAGSLGISVDHVNVTSSAPLEVNSLTTLRATHSMMLQVGSWHQHAAVSSHLTGDLLGIDALSTTTLSLPGPHAVSVSASFARRPLAEQKNLWYWMIQGYEPYLESSRLARGSLYLPPGPGVSTTLTADLTWHTRPARWLRLELQSGFRSFEGLTTGFYTYYTQSGNDGLLPSLMVHNHAQGTVYTSSATAIVRLVPHLHQRLHIGYQELLVGNRSFMQTWSEHPPFRFGYTVRYRPVPRFSLSARLRYLAATEWPAYGPAADENPDVYVDRLPSIWQLHLSAQKQFWRDHLRFSISLRNVLDHPVRTHPAGAPVDMAMFVELRLRL